VSATISTIEASNDPIWSDMLLDSGRTVASTPA
jgi:hypothetical protein